MFFMTLGSSLVPVTMMKARAVARSVWKNAFKCTSLWSSRVLWSTLCSSTDQTHRLNPAQADTLMDVGIRQIFTADHDIFRESTRKFMREEMVPKISMFAEQGFVDRETWAKWGQQGLFGISIPPELGGQGGDAMDVAIVMEEMMYTNISANGMSFHAYFIPQYLAKYGTKDQRAQYLPGIVDGTKISAIAMTEPSAGSDLQGIKTRAVRDGADWLLNGSKVFITNGWLADVVIVVAITNPQAKSLAHGISLFIVEDGTPGFKKGRNLAKLGSHEQDTAELFFDDVRLSADKLLGEENKGFYYLMQELPWERLGMAICGMGAAEYMFEITRDYVKQRKAFGGTLSSLQTVQHKLAEMKTEICISRSFLDQCLQTEVECGLDAQSASMAKYFITDLQNRVAYNCLQLHGGYGYMTEYPISKAYIDARQQPIYGGCNEIMKQLIARKIVSNK